MEKYGDGKDGENILGNTGRCTALSAARVAF